MRKQGEADEVVLEEELKKGWFHVPPAPRLAPKYLG